MSRAQQLIEMCEGTMMFAAKVTYQVSDKKRKGDLIDRTFSIKADSKEDAEKQVLPYLQKDEKGLIVDSLKVIALVRTR